MRKIPQISGTSGACRLNVIPSVVAAVGVAASYLAYAPGIVSPDATDQFNQAQTGRFSDIHPPIMAWLWSKTNAVIPGPEGFFLLLTVLFWVGFFLLIRHLLKFSVIRAVIACVLPFTPILFNFVGTIWKDVLVCCCFLVATGIILTRPFDRTARFRPVSGLLLLILLVLGSMARWNSVPGVIPLLVLTLWPRPPAEAPLRRTAYRLVLCAPIVLLVWAASDKLMDVAVIHAEKAGFTNMLPLWDLVGMSKRLNQNLLPGSWSQQETERIISCYDPIDDNALTMIDTPCSFVRATLARDGYWKASVMFPLWARAIWNHPKVYIDTRLSYVRTLFWPNVVFLFDADDGIGPFNHHSGLLFETEKQILMFFKTAPVLHFAFTVGFWMVAAAILTLAFPIAIMRGWTGCYASLLFSLSAAFNLLPLVIIGPDGQLRFAYWPIVAMFIALLVARRDVATIDMAPEPALVPRPGTA